MLDPNHQRPHLLYTLCCLHRGMNNITEEIIEQKKERNNNTQMPVYETMRIDNM